MPRALILCFAAATLFAAPPVTRKLDVVDTYFGVKIPDPYRWLEDDNSLDTKAWVKAQNEVTSAYLAAIPERSRIQERMTRLWNYERYGTPGRYGKNYVYTHNSGLQNQSVLYVTEKLEEKGRVLLDPNTLSTKGTKALNGTSVSGDGRFLAYGISDAGSDWITWKVRDIATGQDLVDEVPWSKFGGAEWTKDGSGFFYTCYDAPKTGEALTAVNKSQKIRFHKLGTAAVEDRLVYERPDKPDWFLVPAVSEDGRWLILAINEGDSPKNCVLLQDLTKPGSAFQPLFDAFDAQYSVIGNDGDTFYVETDCKAPRKRVVAVDLKNSAQVAWRELIPQAQNKDVIAGATLFGSQLAVTWKVDALNLVRFYDLKGKFLREVKMAGIGTLSGFGGRREDTEAFYSFTSYNQPPTLYRYDLKKGKSSVFRTPKVEVKPENYEVKEVFYASKDGTKVPLFLAHKKGLVLDGTNPTLLYGYGGFNAAMSPGFSVANLVWMEMGGVYALACIRGGNEYGQTWWEQGKRETKQNVFDDFIAAGEYLVAQKITSPAKLAIHGGSNGGLLVGACLTQRPDLFAAAIPAVGVMDMLRYHRFTIGWGWQSDYMCSDFKDGFENLIKYSPLHTIKPGTKYPATLVTTGDHDDRVVPAHSHKFTATLQAAQAGPAPILTRIETDAGHGAGKPTSKQIAERSDMWAFLVKNLGIRLPAGFGK